MLNTNTHDANKVPTQEQANAALIYYPAKGLLVSRATGHALPMTRGLIHINGYRCRPEKLIWLMLFGEYPDVDLIFRNKNESDWRRVNIRYPDGDKVRHHLRTMPLLKGMYWLKRTCKWRVAISRRGVRHNCGEHTDWFEAVCALKSAEARYPAASDLGLPRKPEAGITWHRSRKKWHVTIQKNKKRVFLGQFDAKADAIRARKEAETALREELACPPV